MYQIGIVVPCYNEARRLPADKFLEFARQHSEFHFCFVNDGSTDETLKVLSALKSQLPERLHILDLQPNGGKAEAVRRGLMHMLADQQLTYIGFCDADLSAPLSSFSLFQTHLARATHVEMVLGCRFRRLGSKIVRSFKRHLIGRLFATMASNLLSLQVYDTQCGAKLVHRSLVPTLFNQPFLSRWLFDVEFIARAIAAKGKKHVENTTLEVPLDEWIEIGDSRIKSAQFIKLPLDLLRIFLAYRQAIKQASAHEGTRR